MLLIFVEIRLTEKNVATLSRNTSGLIPILSPVATKILSPPTILKRKRPHIRKQSNPQQVGPSNGPVTCPASRQLSMGDEQVSNDQITDSLIGKVAFLSSVVFLLFT